MKKDLRFKKTAATPLIILLVVLVLSPLTVNSSALNSPAQAIITVRQFAKLLDAGRLNTAFQEGSMVLQQSVNRERWIEQKRRTLQLFGRIVSSKLIKTRAIKTFPFLPDNDYLLTYRDIKMERKERAIEVAVLKVEDGQWKMCSYSIR